MRKRFFQAAFFITLLFIYGYCKNSGSVIDEDELFNDTSTVVNTSEIVNTASMKEENNSKASYFNGVMNSAFFGNVNRKWLDVPDSNNVKLSNYIVGNLMLDVRLPNGGKAFFNLEMPYLPTYSSIVLLLRELFIDGNIAKKVYLRIGKQVLQWGRCRLWNPTDLINVEKKLFIPKIGYREGAYGLKMHIPFGTDYNLYGFLDTKSLSSVDSLAAAGKFEFLMGGTEMAFCLWAKNYYHSVFGYDVSTRIGGLDVVGELSLSKAANTYSIVQVIDTLKREKSDGLQTKACIDVGKKFNLFNFSRNLSVTLSFYFNSVGYDENMFLDTLQYNSDPPYIVQAITGFQPQIEKETKKDFLIRNNFYEQHSYSKYYGALFTQIDRFFLSGLATTFNIVYNLQQASMIASAGISYTSLNEFFTGILVSAYVGGDNTEYTFQNQALAVQINLGMSFY